MLYFRLGFFKMCQVKSFIQKFGVLINGKLCKRIERKLTLGDIITFPKEFNAKKRFLQVLRTQYPYTKKERGFRSLWNYAGIRFNFKLGFLKAGSFWIEPRNFIFMYGYDSQDGQEVFFPFDFDVSKFLKIYQSVK